MMGRSEFAEMAERTLSSYIHSAPQDERIRAVRMTSGTSAQPVVFIRELPSRMPGWFGYSKRLVLCGGSLVWRLGIVLFFIHDTPPTSRVLLIDGDYLADDLVPLVDDFLPDSMAGFPSFLARVSAYVSPRASQHIRSLIMTGEMLTNSLAELLQKQFPNAALRPQYLIQEIGYVGSPTPCPYLNINQYHPAQGVTLEVVDADAEGVGELEVTSRFNEFINLEKYRYGDMVRLSRKRCACGAEMEFEVLGRRGYDFIRLAGALLRREEFDRVSALCRELFDDYRVEATESVVGGAQKGRVVLHVYRSDRGWNDGIAEMIVERFTKELFLTPTKTLGDLVAKGHFLPLVIVREKMAFPKKHKDLKLVYRDA